MKKMLFVILTITLIGCKAKNNKPVNQEMKLTIISKGNLYGAGAEGIKKQNIIIQNESEWHNLITKMNSANKVSDNLSETTINFSKFVVIAVFDEVKGTGGHRLALDLETVTDKIIINISRSAPDGMATTVMTQPYYLAKIPKSDKSIVFK